MSEDGLPVEGAVGAVGVRLAAALGRAYVAAWRRGPPEAKFQWPQEEAAVRSGPLLQQIRLQR